MPNQLTEQEVRDLKLGEYVQVKKGGHTYMVDVVDDVEVRLRNIYNGNKTFRYYSDLTNRPLFRN
jgi:hypothetical protein